MNIKIKLQVTVGLRQYVCFELAYSGDNRNFTVAEKVYGANKYGIVDYRNIEDTNKRI